MHLTKFTTINPTPTTFTKFSNLTKNNSISYFQARKLRIFQQNPQYKFPKCNEKYNTYAKFDYKTCPHHATLLRKGEIVQCDVCGNWHNSNENCTCNNGEKYKDLPTEGFDTCIVCGAETDGYAFCIDCWKKLSRDEMLNKALFHKHDVQRLVARLVRRVADVHHVFFRPRRHSWHFMLIISMFFLVIS